MKKLLSLLSGGLIKDVGNVIDKLTTTDEERLAAKQKIQELLEKADQDAQTHKLPSDGNLTCSLIHFYLKIFGH